MARGLLYGMAMNPAGMVFLAGLVTADVPVESLSGLEAEARARNPGILAARAMARAAGARVAGASNPGEAMVEGARKEDPGMRSTMLEARLTMPFPGASVFSGRAASRSADAAKARAQAMERDVIARVRIAYWRLAKTDATIEAMATSVDLLKQSAAASQARASVRGAPASGAAMGSMGGPTRSGGSAMEEYLLIQAESVKMAAQLAAMRNDRVVIEAELGALLDRPRDRVAFGRAALPELREPAFDADALVARAVASGPEPVAARLEADAAAAEAGRAAVNLLPMVSPFYAVERLETGERGRTYGAALSYPLWVWKPWAERREAVAMREARRAEAAVTAAETARMVRAEVAEARTHWRLAVDYRDAVVPLLDQAVRSTRSSYESGAGDVLRLLTATREWLAARTEEYTQTYHFGEHLALLERALGGPIEETKP